MANDLNSTWINALNSYGYTDWKMFFPNVFWLNWLDPKTWEKEIFDPAIWLPSIYGTPDERSNIQRGFKAIGDYVAGNKVQGDYAGRDINKNRTTFYPQEESECTIRLIGDYVAGHSWTRHYRRSASRNTKGERAEDIIGSR